MKLLLTLLLLPISFFAQDPILAAIKLSNPKTVKNEIEKRVLQGQPLSSDEQLFYLNFCDEIIIRRRNAIQFPVYQSTPVYCNGMITYYNNPVYKNAFTTDVNPEISFNCGVRLLFGTLGTVAALLYWSDLKTNYKRKSNQITTDLVITTGVISFFALFSAIIETEINRKQHQEELYENAIKIKFLFYDMVTS